MPKASLTFDNGPDPDATPYVLDCLARHKVAATFFVIGEKAIQPENAAIVRQASEAGHLIGNHTFSHSTPLGERGADDALREFERAEQAIDSLNLNQTMPLFRPNGRGGLLGPHLLHRAVVEKLQSGGYTCVLWKTVAGDWKNPAWVEGALENCRANPWTLVVLHDIPGGAMQRLDEFIQRLNQEGIEIVQEYPPDCVPIANGKIVLPIQPYCSSRIS